MGLNIARMEAVELRCRKVAVLDRCEATRKRRSKSADNLIPGCRPEGDAIDHCLEFIYPIYMQIQCTLPRRQPFNFSLPEYCKKRDGFSRVMGTVGRLVKMTSWRYRHFRSRAIWNLAAPLVAQRSGDPQKPLVAARRSILLEWSSEKLAARRPQIWGGDLGSARQPSNVRWDNDA